MKITEEGKTPQEAIDKAIKRLGVSRDDIKVEILEKGSKGILGFNSKPAKIEVIVSSDGIESRAKNFLEEVLRFMDFQTTINTRRDRDCIIFEICGKNTGLLIGKRGQTLEALQHLLDRAINKNENLKVKLFIDIEGYRRKREDAVENLALRLAKKVKHTGASATTYPLNPKERRLIHVALSEDKGVKTVSRGNGPMKRIVIYPSNQQIPESNER